MPGQKSWDVPGHTIRCMWPKAFSQLVELAPHVSRLLPLADRFLQSKTATEDPGRRSLDIVSAEAMSARLQAELRRIVAAQDTLAKQIQLLQEGVAAVGSDTLKTKTAIEVLQTGASVAETRTATLETRFSAVEGRLGGMETLLQRISERVRLGPVALLLVLTNLILLAAVIALSVRGR